MYDAIGSIYKMYLLTPFRYGIYIFLWSYFINQIFMKTMKQSLTILSFLVINFVKVAAYTSLSFMKESTMEILKNPLLTRCDKFQG